MGFLLSPIAKYQLTTIQLDGHSRELERLIERKEQENTWAVGIIGIPYFN